MNSFLMKIHRIQLMILNLANIISLDLGIQLLILGLILKIMV